MYLNETKPMDNTTRESACFVVASTLEGNKETLEVPHIFNGIGS